MRTPDPNTPESSPRDRAFLTAPRKAANRTFDTHRRHSSIVSKRRFGIALGSRVFLTIAAFCASVVCFAGNAYAACPDNVPGCTLWLDAGSGVYTDGGITPSADGNTVQQWTDVSGSGFNATQAASGQRPTYRANVGGFPALQFSSTTRMLVGGNSDFTSPAFTVFAVVQRTGNGGYQSILNKGNGTSAAGSTWELEASAANDNNVSLDTFYGSTNNIMSASSTTQQWSVITGERIDSTHKLLDRNGAEVATGSDLGNALNAGQYPLGIGNSGSTGSIPLVGYIRAIVYYPSALSTAQRQAIEQYFAAKYSISMAQFVSPHFLISTFNHSESPTVSLYMYNTTDGVSFSTPSEVTNPAYTFPSNNGAGTTMHTGASSVMYYDSKYWLAYEMNAFSGTQTSFGIANASSLLPWHGSCSTYPLVLSQEKESSHVDRIARRPSAVR